jgi:hypothetical protein
MTKSHERILGAYAAHPVQSDFSGSSDETWFYEQVARLSGVTGLELPFNGALHKSGAAYLAKILPKDYSIVVTCLPGQMQRMALQSDFGLASPSAVGRDSALAFYQSLFAQIEELASLRSDLRFIGIECHSGPRAPNQNAFSRSLASLLANDFFLKFPDVKMLIEHCDSWRTDRPVAKGFLRLSEAVAVATEYAERGVGMTLNWGRSFIDTQSEVGVTVQLETVISTGLLSGLIYSGASLGHPMYGSSFEDSHAPLRSSWKGESPELLALTDREVEKNSALALSAGAWLGIKVQALPKDLDMQDRLVFLQSHTSKIFA